MQRTEDVFEMFAIAVRINTINYFKNFLVKKVNCQLKENLMKNFQTKGKLMSSKNTMFRLYGIGLNSNVI